MTIDAQIKSAQERLHRQIGQWARFAHRKVAERAQWERAAMNGAQSNVGWMLGILAKARGEIGS